MSPFAEIVISTIRKIPKGRVASYGLIAKLAGKAHASRAVSWILHSRSESHRLPWHRVINSQGKISFPPLSREAIRQERLLKSEGVEFSPSGKVLADFSWSPSPARRRSSKI